MAAKEKTKKMYSLDDLNLVKKCDDSIEFEVLDEKGNGTDIFISVIGGHSEKVQNAYNKKINHRKRVALAQSKRGKNEEITLIEDDIEFGVEMAALRITGWRNITDDFNHENAIRLCTINPEIKKQVVDFSEALGNLKIA